MIPLRHIQIDSREAPMDQKQIITTRTRLNLTTCLYLIPTNRARSLSTLRDWGRSKGIHQSKSRLKDYKIREHSKRPSPLSLLSKIGGTLQRVVEQEVQHKHLRSPDTERESNFNRRRNRSGTMKRIRTLLLTAGRIEKCPMKP